MQRKNLMGMTVLAATMSLLAACEPKERMPAESTAAVVPTPPTEAGKETEPAPAPAPVSEASPQVARIQERPVEPAVPVVVQKEPTLAEPTPPPSPVESDVPVPAAPMVVTPEPIVMVATTDPLVLKMKLLDVNDDTGFAANAFPPSMPDTDWHREGWMKNDCMRCHETGVGNAPVVRHEGLPGILLVAKCRSCHVIEPGLAPTGTKDNAIDTRFNRGAFPPVMPNSTSHRNAWTAHDCLLCHESGVKGAPILRHRGLPEIYRSVKCRSCHVQVRAFDDVDDVPSR